MNKVDSDFFRVLCYRLGQVDSARGFRTPSQLTLLIGIVGIRDLVDAMAKIHVLQQEAVQLNLSLYKFRARANRLTKRAEMMKTEEAINPILSEMKILLANATNCTKRLLEIESEIENG